MTIRNTETNSARTMFHRPTMGSFMLRGPQVTYDLEDDTRSADTAAAEEAEAARIAAEKAEAEKAETEKTRPTDTEAKLLKEAMKHKAEAKAAKDALEAAQGRLRDFDGIDPAAIRKLLDEKKAAELAESERRGEYDRIIKQVREDADAREAAARAQTEETREQLKSAQKKIDDLVIGKGFSGSRFLNDDTILTGDKARKLYGDHFEIENGELVAFDKPKGSSDRTPLVDPKTGDKLGFEAALEKIMKADPDFERIAKSKLRPGSNSNSSNVDNKTNNNNAKQLHGVGIISAALDKLTKSVP